MSTRQVTLTTFVQLYGGTLGNQWYNNNLYSILASSGWSIVHLYINDANDVAPSTVSVVLMANVGTQYYDDQIKASFLSAIQQSGLGNDGAVVGDVLLTDTAVSSTQTHSNPASTNIGNTNTTVNRGTMSNSGTATFVGTVNGFDIYKDSQGCFYYDDMLGVVPVDCPSGNFLEQIGKALGFGKSTGLGKTGITAAAGGAVALVLVAFLLTRR